MATSIAHPIVRLNYRLRRYIEPIGAVVVFASLNEAGRASPSMIGLLLLWAVAWPQVAYLLARGSIDKRAEHHNLLVDSLMMGAWTAAIHFDLWPSVLLIATVTNSNLGIGGAWLFVRGLAAVAIGVVGV
ncbi:MAG: MASE2 domain-containing protein, partial [Rhodanobacter sp.]